MVKLLGSSRSREVLTRGARWTVKFIKAKPLADGLRRQSIWQSRYLDIRTRRANDAR
jgi:hypothetical protein